MSLREKNKQARRERILDAAARLLVREGAEGLTMRELASAAGVAEMTPYNLFGSKAEIVATLFENEIERIVARSFSEMPSDPVERLFVSAEILADTWTEESGLFRELVRAAREAGADPARYAGGPTSLLEAGLNDAVAAGRLTDDLPPPDLARYIFFANQGAYEAWAEGVLDDHALRRDLVVGLGISLLAVATEPTRRRVLARMAAARDTKPTAKRRTQNKKKARA